MDYRTCSTCGGTGKERHGSAVAPLDISHPAIAEVPEERRQQWLKVAASPEQWRYVSSTGTSFPLIQLAMYDGWPYWEPRPAAQYMGPLGPEWYSLSAHTRFTAAPSGRKEG